MELFYPLDIFTIFAPGPDVAAQSAPFTPGSDVGKLSLSRHWPGISHGLKNLEQELSRSDKRLEQTCIVHLFITTTLE